ncbi:MULTISPECIES: hypothetical protein [unclassified Streptomyces]|uniref:hypothetical protein n=1 Tax=unclassified Streptomyces TaxID=2593676 RepID=UPI0033A6BBF0
MNEPAPTGTALVQTEYHLFHITDPHGPVAADLDANRTGLVSADGGAIEVATGTHTADVHVTVETHAQAPDPDPGWEEIAEISCHSSSGRLLVTSFTDEPADLPSLASHGPGPYRLRVHARGRDRAVDQTTLDEVAESYLIQSWPAAHQDALLVKTTDAYGAQVRAQPTDDTIIIDHENSRDTPSGRERDILHRAERGEYS